MLYRFRHWFAQIFLRLFLRPPAEAIPGVTERLIAWINRGVEAIIIEVRPGRPTVVMGRFKVAFQEIESWSEPELDQFLADALDLVGSRSITDFMACQALADVDMGNATVLLHLDVVPVSPVGINVALEIKAVVMGDECGLPAAKEGTQ